jgi:hypothetical protein
LKDPPRGKTPAPVFALTLQPVPGDVRPPETRLKQALKHLLRRCGLRCVALREVVDDEGSAA